MQNRISQLLMSARATEHSYSDAVEQNYEDYPGCYPARSGAPEDVRVLPKSQVILRWVGSGRRVLDLGCNRGAIGELLRRQRNEVIGVDFPLLVKDARITHGLPVVARDLNQPLPFRHERFDVVIASSVLDYIAGDLAFLRECYRVLEPGGLLIVVVLNEFSLIKRIKTLLGHADRDFRHPGGFHNLNRYPLYGIQALIELAGFRVTDRAKCPLLHPKLKAWGMVEQLLPATFATDLAVKAIKPSKS